MNKLLVVILVSGLSFFTVHVHADQKIGFVDFERILRDAPETAESVKKLEKEFTPRTADLDKLKKQITDLESADKSKQQELNNLKIEFERKGRELNEDISLRKNEELAAIQERIAKAVTAIAEKEQYDIVLYAGIAYVSKKVDLTEQVLKSLGISSK